MTLDQLTGKYARLRAELAEAYAEPEWSTCRSGHIDRIAGELIEMERALASGPGPRYDALAPQDPAETRH